MSRHPGRLAALKHAADMSDDITNTERANLIRLGAPDHPAEHVYAQLCRYTELLQAWRRPDALAVLEALTEPPADRAGGDRK